MHCTAAIAQCNNNNKQIFYALYTVAICPPSFSSPPVSLLYLSFFPSAHFLPKYILLAHASTGIHLYM